MAKTKKNALSAGELSSFCGQVAMILESGIPLYDGMETLAGIGRDTEFGELYEKASKTVTATGSLYQALQEDSRWPEYLTQMTGIGERTGQLNKVMRGLETYYAREERIRSSVRNAATYPLLLGGILVVILLILLWKVMPVFRRVLSSMGVTESQSGAALIHFGSALGWVVMAVVAAALIFLLVIVLLLRTSRRQKVLTWLQKRIPAVRRLRQTFASSRIAGILSMMLSGGFPAGEALEMASSALQDPEAQEKVEGIRRHLEEGETFADAVTHAELFDELQNRMIVMGSAAGREDQALEKIAAQNEEKAEEEITRAVSIIEPTLVVILAVITGAVLLSVMLSMTGILTSL